MVRLSGQGSKIARRLLIIIFLVGCRLYAADDIERQTLYASLDPSSIAKQLAFYKLYPDSAEGERALNRAFLLLSSAGCAPTTDFRQLEEPGRLVSLIDRFAHQDLQDGVELKAEELELIQSLAQDLPHRRLKGHQTFSINEIAKLPAEEIDLARGLLLTFLGEGERRAVESYEALIDLMALQILARVGQEASAGQKIAAINQLIFFEMGMRFPPRSEQGSEVYTFLPSVLGKRRGVCLGVSCLYLCLGQRLNLELEAVTPPGHIYVRAKENNRTINIETTARGVALPTDTYMGLTPSSLKQRNIKEVVGLTFMNQGAALWQADQRIKAVEAYQKALVFLPTDPLIHEFLSYNLLATGALEEALFHLGEAVRYAEALGDTPSMAALDLLERRTDQEGIEALFMQTDESRSSILDKQQRLAASVARYPKFRAGWLQLAMTWIQLGRGQEALEALHRACELGPPDPTAEYTAAVVCLQRRDFNQAWRHLIQVEELVTGKEKPPALTELRRTLKELCPE